MIFTSFIKNGKGHGKRWLLLFSVLFGIAFYFCFPLMMSVLPAQFRKILLESIESNSEITALSAALDERAVLRDENGNEVAKVFPIEFQNGELVSPKAHSIINGTDDEGNPSQLIVDTLSDTINTAELTQRGAIFGRKSIVVRMNNGSFFTINYPPESLTITKEQIIDGTVVDNLIPFVKKMISQPLTIPATSASATEGRSIDMQSVLRTVFATIAVILTCCIFIFAVIFAFILSLFVEPLSKLLNADLDSSQAKRLSALVMICYGVLGTLLIPYYNLSFVMQFLVWLVLATLLILATKASEKA